MRIRTISEVIGMRVYTDSGDFFGAVEEANLFENRVDGWRIRVGSGVSPLLGGARGVIVPQNFVKAISDVFIINKAALPGASERDLDEVSSEEMM